MVNLGLNVLNFNIVLKVLKEIEKLVNDFFSKLEIDIESTEIIEEAEDIFLVKIKTKDSPIVIGPHWKNLEAIKNILKIMISKNLEKKIILHLEVNDYLKSKEDKLLIMVKRKIDFLKKSWKDVEMPFLSAYERKKVHSFISDMWDDYIFTKSMWEWAERRLFICTKGEKLEIDIDWDDI